MIETLDSPIPESLPRYELEHKLYEAKCYLPDTLFRWAQLVKTDSIIECWDGGRNIDIFEVEEKELKAEKRGKYVKSYLMPALTYESQIVTYSYTRLNLKRRVWEDEAGNKYMASHKLNIHGFIKAYFMREIDGMEEIKNISVEELSTPTKLLSAYQKADTFFEKKKQERLEIKKKREWNDEASEKHQSRAAHKESTTNSIWSSSSPSSSKSKKQKREYGTRFSTDDVYADENYSFRSKNLADQIERESWLDEIDRSEKEDPWD